MDNPNLIELIKSLKISERRYLVLYLSKHKKDNNYLKLYNFLNKNGDSAIINISNEIGDKKFLARINQNKYELYNLILDALHNFELRKSPYARILTMLHQSEILTHKGLMNARKDLLLKAERLAETYELYELKLEILRLKNCWDVTPSSKKILIESKSLSEKIILQAKLKHLFTQVSKITPNERLNPTQLNKTKAVINEFGKEKKAANTFFSRHFYFDLLLRYHTVIGNFPSSHKYGSQIIKLFKQRPEMFRLEIWKVRYFNSLLNLFISPYFIKNKIFDFVQKELLDLDVSEKHKRLIDVTVLLSYINIGEFQRGEKFLKNIEDHIDLFKKHLNSHNAIANYCNLAIMNLGLENHTKALYWLNKALNDPALPVADIQFVEIIKAIRLLTYYELNQFDTIELQFRSVYRNTIIQKNVFKSDIVILQTLRKMISTPDKNELKKMLRLSVDELLKLSKVRSEAITFEMFDFISWFESKIENKKFGEIVREKWQKKLKV